MYFWFTQSEQVLNWLWFSLNKERFTPHCLINNYLYNVRHKAFDQMTIKSILYIPAKEIPHFSIVTGLHFLHSSALQGPWLRRSVNANITFYHFSELAASFREATGSFVAFSWSSEVGSMQLWSSKRYLNQ